MKITKTELSGKRFKRSELKFNPVEIIPDIQTEKLKELGIEESLKKSLSELTYSHQNEKT